MKIIMNEDTDGREEYDSVESLLNHLESGEYASRRYISAVKYFLNQKCTTFMVVKNLSPVSPRDQYIVEYD